MHIYIYFFYIFVLTLTINVVLYSLMLTKETYASSTDRGVVCMYVRTYVMEVIILYLRDIQILSFCE